MVSNENNFSQVISSVQRELPHKQTNPFLLHNKHSPPPSRKPFRELFQEYRSGILKNPDSRSSGDWWEDSGADNTTSAESKDWWEDHEADNTTSAESTTRSNSPEASTAATSYISLLNFSNIEYSDSEYSDDNHIDDDCDDDEFSSMVPPPSSYEDLFNKCFGPEPTKKRYRSGWWEQVGIDERNFPASYQNYQNSHRLPSILEESEDEVTSDPQNEEESITNSDYSDSEYSDDESDISKTSFSGSEYSGDGDDISDASFSDDDIDDDDDDDFFDFSTPSISNFGNISCTDLTKICIIPGRYRSGWWEKVGSTRKRFPISYTNYENSNHLPTILEESDEDVIISGLIVEEKSINSSYSDSEYPVEDDMSDISSSSSEYSNDGDDIYDTSISGSEYSGDEDDISDASFSDDDIDDYDDFFDFSTPTISNHASISCTDLTKMCIVPGRYRSGWWEKVGSTRKRFPTSYTDYENSNRLPQILEDPDDDISSRLCVDEPEISEQKTRPVWWNMGPRPRLCIDEPEIGEQKTRPVWWNMGPRPRLCIDEPEIGEQKIRSIWWNIGSSLSRLCAFGLSDVS